MLSDSNFPIALLLTLIAGLSTGLGGVIVLLTRKFSTKTLSFALGFSAGVMLFISMTELFAEARASLGSAFGERTGLLYTVLAFFAGIALIALIDNLIPSKDNPHEYSAAPSEALPCVLLAFPIPLHAPCQTAYPWRPSLHSHYQAADS